MEFLKDYIASGVVISSVVKGNAYGHGIEQYIPLAEEFGINHFSVFSADEAMRVYNAITLPHTILIMGHLEDEEIEWAINKGIEFYVFDYGRLEKSLEIAKKLNKPAIVHLEVETGMNRTGLENGEVKEAIKLLKDHPKYLHFQGLCTHYAGAESIANYYRVKKQRSNFEKIKKVFLKDGLQPVQYHTACSAAALRYPKTHMDMVRIGILQYGFFPSTEIGVEYMTRKKHNINPLKRLISWKTNVMDVKHVKAGEFIGYGTSYLANQDMKIAIIPIGYSHGYTRNLSNQGRVLIHGKRLAVVGMVNMNMMAIDITYTEGVKKGDEVVLIGKQGDMEISVSSFGTASDQINYELLTRLPGNIPRYIVD
jgi:alanine racemase